MKHRSFGSSSDKPTRKLDARLVLEGFQTRVSTSPLFEERRRSVRSDGNGVFARRKISGDLSEPIAPRRLRVTRRVISRERSLSIADANINIKKWNWVDRLRL